MSIFYAGFDVKGVLVRVRFEQGSRFKLDQEMETLGCKHALVLTTPQQTSQGEEIIASLGELACGLYTNATMHTPVEASEAATKLATDLKADVIIAIGGGSTTGLAKAIAYRTDLPQIILPTTYAGSEATPVLGQIENRVKNTFSSPKVQPEVIVYDPDLVASLPAKMTITSGLNAMAHAVGGLCSKNANLLSDQLALAGIKVFVSGLPSVTKDLGNIKARTDTLFGSWLCGTVLAQGGMTLHHKLCHILGGSLNLPHSEVHAIILPHATAYNEQSIPDALSPVADILGCESAGIGLYKFAKDLGAPTALKSLGVSNSDLDLAAKLSVKNAYWNPRNIEYDAVRELLQRAWEGVSPK